MSHAGKLVKGPGGKAFSNASIGEAGEKAFPAGADGSNERRFLSNIPMLKLSINMVYSWSLA